MNTLDRILKQHSKVFDLHNKFKDTIKYDKRILLYLIIMILEVILALYLISIEKVFLGIITFVFYFLTIIVISYFHFKQIENRYGSANYFDEKRIDRFILLTKQNVNIELRVSEENLLLEQIVQEEVSKTNKKDQTKKTFYLTMLSVALPIFLPYLWKNLDNIIFLTLIISFVGVIILFFSINDLFKEYKKISKLEHLSSILKEVRLMQVVNKRN